MVVKTKIDRYRQQSEELVAEKAQSLKLKDVEIE